VQEERDSGPWTVKAFCEVTGGWVTDGGKPINGNSYRRFMKKSGTMDGCESGFIGEIRPSISCLFARGLCGIEMEGADYG
jgi:hypothetical protein